MFTTFQLAATEMLENPRASSGTSECPDDGISFVDITERHDAWFLDSHRA